MTSNPTPDRPADRSLPHRAAKGAGVAGLRAFAIVRRAFGRSRSQAAIGGAAAGARLARRLGRAAALGLGLAAGGIGPAASQDAPGARQAPSGADAVCGARADVVARLGRDYGETRRGHGLQRATAVVEVFASEATGSWTIIVTSPNGVACLVAAGEHWAPAPAEAANAADKDA